VFESELPVRLGRAKGIKSGIRMRGTIRETAVRQRFPAVFDPSRPSHAVGQLKIVCTQIAKSPQNRGLFAFLAVHPNYRNRQLTREIAESLQPLREIFPFSGDPRRRPFSICTEW